MISAMPRLLLALALLDVSPPLAGFRGEIWIADQAGKVVVLNGAGREIFVKEGLGAIRDVDVRPNGAFVVGGLDRKVREFSRDGKLLWEHTARAPVYSVRYLPNGELLVGEHRALVHLRRDGTIAWEHAGGSCPEDTQVLPGGSYLVAWYGSSKIEEVHPKRGVLWTRSEPQPMGLHQLRDGTLLVACVSAQCPKIIRRDGEVLWEHKVGKDTPGASVTRNGSVLIATWDSVLRVDRAGRTLWTCAARRAIKAREY
jgi:outer membrane protein assembly factor BamB